MRISMRLRAASVAVLTGCVLAGPATNAGPAAAATPAGNAAAGTPVSAAGPAAAAMTTEPDSFVSRAPTRVLDTRYGIGAARRPIGVNGQLVLSLSSYLPAGSSAAVLNVTVTDTTGAGTLAVVPQGTPRPTPNSNKTSNLNFGKGQTIANLVVSKLSASAQIAFYYAGGGTIQLVADLSGYYTAGSAPTVPGGYGAVAPNRLLDTRSRQGGVSGPLASGTTITFGVTGGSVPSSGVAAVLLNVTVTGPRAAGFVTAFASGSSRPAASNLNFVAGQTVPNLVLAPVGADGRVALYTFGGGGSTQLIADIAGYYRAWVPATAGALGVLAPHRILDTRLTGGAPVKPYGTLSFAVTGVGGVPVSGVSSVVLNVTAVSPTQGGNLTAYPSTLSPRPTASNLNFPAGLTVPNLVMVAPGSDGQVTLYNNSPAPLQVVADVAGFHLSGDLPVPDSSASRYVRTITGGSGDAAVMLAAGVADAQPAGAHLVVLDIGAQTDNAALPSPGVKLSATETRLTYAQLVTALQGYLQGYHDGGGSTVTIAVAANSGGVYDAATMGADWARSVIEPLVGYAAGLTSSMTVIGADDIEAGFAMTEPQVESWINAYLAAAGSTAPLLEVGSADGCPSGFGTTGVSCGAVAGDAPTPNTWTQAQYYRMAHGLSPSRILVMPQVYSVDQAAEWRNIDSTGARGADRITFLGALTEVAACAQASPACTSLPPAQGWAALRLALSSVPLLSSTTLPYVTDLAS